MIDTNLETNMLSIVRVNEPGRKKNHGYRSAPKNTYLSFLLKKLPEDDTNLYQANQTSHNNLT